MFLQHNFIPGFWGSEITNMIIEPKLETLTLTNFNFDPAQQKVDVLVKYEVNF